MKKLSLLPGLFILAVMLCGPVDTLPQSEPAQRKTASQTKTIVVDMIELCRELPQPKLSDSELEPLTLPQEVVSMETLETTPAEPDEYPVASTARPEPITESKPAKPPVNEPASTAPQSGSGLPGFDYVPYLGPNVVIYAEDMYENGNKIGIMGDINKQVGIMD